MANLEQISHTCRVQRIPSAPLSQLMDTVISGRPHRISGIRFRLDRGLLIDVYPVNPVHHISKTSRVPVLGPTITQDASLVAWGCYTHPQITYVQRLKILKAAKSLVARSINYTPTNVLLPHGWNGKLDTIDKLRCDGLVEVCYEINGVNVWAMHRNASGDTGCHFNISDTSDIWTYYPVWGTWAAGSNSLFDNLEEHNDCDLLYGGDWQDTLWPATQCGHVISTSHCTCFIKQDICKPIGSKGGN